MRLPIACDSMVSLRSAIAPAGNVVNDGVNQYLYDADGRICAVSNAGAAGLTTMTGYIYDAGGTSVSKGSMSAWSCDPTINGYQTTNDHVLGQAGEQVTDRGVNANITLALQHTNVFAAGKLIATYVMTVCTSISMIPWQPSRPNGPCRGDRTNLCQPAFWGWPKLQQFQSIFN